MRIKFLGSGGGRFVTSYQLRRTGGFLIEDGLLIHVDPGPGAVRALRDFGEDVRKIDVLVVSHNHPDHVTDAAVVMEGMTHGTTRKRGRVLVAESVVECKDGYRVVSDYHLSLVEEWKVVRPGDVVSPFTFIPAIHTDPKTVGFLYKGKRTVTYYSDTGYWDGMEKYAKDIVIFNLEVLKPLSTHTHPGVVRKVLEKSSPRAVVITHFGYSVLRYGPERLGREIESEFGVEVIVASDGGVWREKVTIFDF